MDEVRPKVLFLCTGNYYRSRFAELLFNHMAAERGLAWRADSAGLALERGLHNVGPIARVVRDAAARLGVSLADDLRMPRTVEQGDLESADVIVALKDAEHRPLVVERWPGWEDRIEYWHVHDVDCGTVEEAIAGIEEMVRGMMKRL